MATNRPFNFGDRNYLDDLNDLANSGIPRVRADPTDPDSAAVNVSADRQMTFDDNGYIADVTASCTISFNSSCLSDGWSMFVHVVTGTLTLSATPAGTTFVGGVATKSVTAGNAALISCNGTTFRIFRMTAT